MARPRNFDEQQVVERAMDLFWSKGYRETTPRELMEATGLSKSSLYATFGNKEGLFLRAMARYVALNRAQMRSMLAQPDLRSALEQMYEMVIQMSLGGPEGRTCLVCTTTLEAGAEDEALLASVQEGQRQILGVFQERLEQAQREGQLSPERDARGLAHFLMSNNNGIQVLARGGASRDDLQRVATQVIETVMG